MNLREVVVAGAGALPERRAMRPDVLAQSAGATSSTVYSFMDERRNKATINLIQKPCDGLGVSLTECFDDEVFK